MAGRALILIALVIGILTLLMGAWTDSAQQSPQEPDASFVPQSLPLAPEIIGDGVDAKQLLQAALDKLAPERMPWLNTKVRQTLTDAGSGYVAEGFLQRGPGHCARLEMNQGDENGLCVVSDGETVVSVKRWLQAAPQVVVENLPDDEAAKEEVLIAKGCAGPATVLRKIRQHLKDGTLQTGLLEKVPVIRIRGDVEADANTTGIKTAVPVSSVYVYLDAVTLWPRRLEWHGVGKDNIRRQVVCLEFTPSAHRELTEAECTRMFSYRPDEDAR